MEFNSKLRTCLWFDGKGEETMVFAWVIRPSSDVRKAAWAKAIEDPRQQPGKNPMPFDGKWMIYGGFETIVDF